MKKSVERLEVGIIIKFDSLTLRDIEHRGSIFGKRIAGYQNSLSCSRSISSSKTQYLGSTNQRITIAIIQSPAHTITSHIDKMPSVRSVAILQCIAKKHKSGSIQRRIGIAIIGHQQNLMRSGLNCRVLKCESCGIARNDSGLEISYIRHSSSQIGSVDGYIETGTIDGVGELSYIVSLS